MHMSQNLFLSENCSTCFGFYYHTYSGAPTTHSHQFQLFHDSNRQQYGYVHHYYIEPTEFFAESTLFNNCNFNLVYRYSLSVKFKSVYYSVTVTRCCSYSGFVLLKMGDSKTRNMQSSSQTKINSVTCATCRDLYTRILLRCTD